MGLMVLQLSNCYPKNQITKFNTDINKLRNSNIDTCEDIEMIESRISDGIFLGYDGAKLLGYAISFPYKQEEIEKNNNEIKIEKINDNSNIIVISEIKSDYQEVYEKILNTIIKYYTEKDMKRIYLLDKTREELAISIGFKKKSNMLIYEV